MPGCHEVAKAELHLHLEGSATPETMHELAPEASMEEIHERFRFNNFAGFLECFKWVVERLRGPEDYALVTRRLLETLDSQNVRYAEITLSAGVVLWKKQQFGPIFDAVPDWFTEVYRFARAKGLRLTAHAGETVGPESVWGALRLGAERIGHGIRAVDDPVLMRHLRDENIPLEICISSNVATGAVPSLTAHPVRRLYDAGVPITLNTDDPGLFDTTLEKEYDLAAREFGFSERELAQIAENGFRYAFAGATPEPPDVKKAGQRL